MSELPVWADIMLLRSGRRRTNVWHIRRGWNAYEGYETRCGKRMKRVDEQPVMVAGGTIISGADPVCDKCETRWRNATRGQ